MVKNIQVLILIIFSTIAYGREAPISRDAAVWFNIYLKKKITKNFALHLNQQNRFNSNVSTFGLWYADFGVTYKVNKNVKFLGDYVFAQKQKQAYWSNRHQFYIAMYLSKKYARWKFTNRNMIQNGYSDILSSERGKISNLYYRNKLTLKREANKYISYYVAQELYFPINNYRQKSVDRSRSFIGIFYALSRLDEVEFYFLFQNELNSTKRKTQDFVYGIGYSKKF